MPTSADFNAGLNTAAQLILNKSIALTGTNDAAVGQPPETIPYTVLEELYNEVLGEKETL